MYCQNCGNKIEDDSKYCPICGARVQTVDAPKPEPPKEEPKQEQTEEPKTNYTYYDNGTNTTNKTSDDNSRTLAIIGLIFAFIFPLIGLILSIIAYRKQKESADSSYKNIALAGIIVGAVSVGAGLLTTIVAFPVIFASILAMTGFVI